MYGGHGFLIVLAMFGIVERAAQIEDRTVCQFSSLTNCISGLIMVWLFSKTLISRRNSLSSIDCPGIIGLVILERGKRILELETFTDIRKALGVTS